MKSVLAVAIATGALWSATPTIATSADPYRWCAELGSGNDGGGTNCYFITRAQCEATVSGIGGFCRHNHFFTGPYGDDDAQPRRIHKKRTAR